MPRTPRRSLWSWIGRSLCCMRMTGTRPFTSACRPMWSSFQGACVYALLFEALGILWASMT